MSLMNTAGITERAEHIQFLISAWHDFGYENPPAPDCTPVPPLGQRSAEAVTAGHAAIDKIDELVAELHKLRGQLIDELSTNADMRAPRKAEG